MPRTALFPGSFHPLPHGHVELVRQAVRLADRLVLAIGTHPGKAPLFSAQERLAMLQETCGPLARAGGCELASKTVPDLRKAQGPREGATLLVRDPRSATDFDYEMRWNGARPSSMEMMGCANAPASPSIRPITAT